MAKYSRLISVDILRGLAVAFMIIIASPGSLQYVYSPLRNSLWHGCTPADIVFPLFLYISGVSMWLSFRKSGHQLNWNALLRIIRRTLSLYALGLFLNIFPFTGNDLSTVRVMGVLQRIALVSGIGALICLVIDSDYLWIVIFFLLILYWALLVFFGGPDPFSLEGNFALRVDQYILGEDHLYKGYGIPFDTEGLLSTIPSVCTFITGFYTVKVLGKRTGDVRAVLKIMIIGASLTGLGLLWNTFFPINRPLWTSSFVLYTSGLAMALLALVHWLTEIVKFRKWGRFFMVFGTNALFSYFIARIWSYLLLRIKISIDCNEINLHSWMYEKIFVPAAGNMKGSLMFAICQMLIIWLISLILFRKKLMIRL